MRICLLGHYGKKTDEGVRSIAKSLYINLKKNHQVSKFDVSKFFGSLGQIKRFNPDVVHIIVGPSTISSFILTKFAQIFVGKPVIMSAPQPTRFHFEGLIRFLKPDLILVQSDDSDKRFRSYGCKTHFLPAGVDLKRFKPTNNEEKIRLRKELGYKESDQIFLHVGHITKGRNLTKLIRLQKLGTVLVIGSSSTEPNPELRRTLEKKGIKIFFDYKPNIEDYYKIADHYVFPTKTRYACIDTPLSVLEAMATNLSVFSTKFGALPKMFPNPPDGFFFITSVSDIRGNLMKIDCSDTKTRNAVTKYSWTKICKELEKIYADYV